MELIIQLLIIPAASAYFNNDILGIFSFGGSTILFLAEFRNSQFKRLVGLAGYHSAPLVFGSLFQVAFFLIGMAPETRRLGIVLPMTPTMVSLLFIVSYMLLGGRQWMRRNPSIHV